MKVLNFGSVNIDYTYQVPHFVRPGETLSASVVTRNAGGKGFNQSIALARAGCAVHHAGHIGADGMFLKELLAENGVAADLLTVGETGTGNAIIQVDESGANCIILYGGANQTMDIDFIRSVISGFGAGDMIVLQNEINCMDEILKEAHDAGLTIALNPAPMNDRISRDAMALLREEHVRTHNGAGLTVRVYRNPEMEAVCGRIAGLFGILGCVNMEFVLDEQGVYHFLEVNPRFSGTRPGAAQSVPTLEEVLHCDLQPGEFE